jgi:photosystem II stability/assembly factor-like uncharacterized protein
MFTLNRNFAFPIIFAALFACAFWWTGCALSPRSDGDVVYPSAGATTSGGFSPEEIRQILDYAKSGQAGIPLAAQVDASSFYRFDLLNDQGARRLAVILSHRQALASPTFGLDTTARVLLYQAKMVTAGQTFDYFAFADTLSQDSVDRVVAAMLPALTDPTFLLQSPGDIGSVPQVLAAVASEVDSLPDLAASDFTASPLPDNPLTIDLRLHFTGLDEKALASLVFSDELQSFFQKLQNEGLAGSRLVRSNVVLRPLLRPKILASVLDGKPFEMARIAGFSSVQAKTRVGFDMPPGDLDPPVQILYHPDQISFNVLVRDLPLVRKLDWSGDGLLATVNSGEGERIATTTDGSVANCIGMNINIAYSYVFPHAEVKSFAAVQSGGTIIGAGLTVDHYQGNLSDSAAVFAVEKEQPLTLKRPPAGVVATLTLYATSGETDFTALSSWAEKALAGTTARGASLTAQMTPAVASAQWGGLAESPFTNISHPLIDGTKWVVWQGQVLGAGALAAAACDPATAFSDQSFTTILTGSGFKAGTTVTLVRSGFASVPAHAAVCQDAGHLACTFNLTGVATGTWDVLLTGPDGQKARGTRLLTLSARGPIVTAVTPRIVPNFGQIASLTVTGSNFRPGATVRLTRVGQTGVGATSVTHNADGTVLSCSFQLTGQAPGPWNLTVTNPDGPSGTGAEMLTLDLLSAAPNVTAISTSSVPILWYNRTAITVTGSGFHPQAACRMTRAGYPPLTAGKVSVSADGTSLAAEFQLKGMASGPWQIVVINPDGQSINASQTLSIYTPRPFIEKAYPDTLYLNELLVNPNVQVSFTGSYLMEIATFSVYNSLGMSASRGADRVSGWSDNDITVRFRLSDMGTGMFNCRAFTRDGQTIIFEHMFFIAYVPPGTMLTSDMKVISSRVIRNSGITRIEVEGGPFESGGFNHTRMPAWLSRSGYAPVTGEVFVNISGDFLTLRVDAGKLVPGTWLLNIKNLNGTNARGDGWITVVDWPPPSVTGVSVTTAPNTGLLSGVTVTGVGIVDGTRSRLVRAGKTAIAGSSITVAGNLQGLTCAFDLTGAATGTWDLEIVGPDGAVATKTQALLVTTPAPTVTAIAPAAAMNTGSLLAAQISGTGLLTGATVILGRAGSTSTIAASAVTATSDGTRLTATFNLTGVATGAWSITVGNPDGQSTTATGLFTVTAPAPAFTSVTPAVVSNGGNLDNVAIKGTAFLSGLRVTLTRSGQTTVQATNVVVQADGLGLSCTMPLAGLAAGAWNLVITNPDGQPVTAENALTVNSALTPSLASISPAKAVGGTLVTLTGDSLGTGGALKVGTTDVTGITSWTSTSIVFTIPDGLALGTHNVTVTPTGASTAAAKTLEIVPWVTVTQSGVTADLKDVAFDGTTGWIVGGETILKSTDTGTSWNAVTGAIGEVMGVDLRAVTARSGKVMMAGYSSTMGSAYWLSNRTGSWVENNNSESKSLWCAAGWDMNTNVVLGGIHWQAPDNAAGQIAYSNGSGGWTNIVTGGGLSLPTSLPSLVRGLATPDGTNYWAVGDPPLAGPAGWGLAKSTDQGQTWTMYPDTFTTTPPNVGYWDVCFVDASNGWAVGSAGTIIHTTDGGARWSQQTTPGSVSGTALRGVWFTSTTNGYTVGDGGIVLATTNGGTTWTAQTSGTTADLWAVRFTDTNKGWIVGNSGTILKTITGGR